MYPFDLTPAARRALDAATKLGQESGGSRQAAAHLFKSLIEEEEGRAATLLKSAGLSLGAISNVLANPMCVAETLASPLGYTAADPVEEIVHYAHELAVDLHGETIVASEHLLLSLLRKSDWLREAMIREGLDFGRIENDLVAPATSPISLDEPLLLAEPSEQVDTARILDASANRCREALRVLEDYCRFSLDDRHLAGELKSFRHELARVLLRLPATYLLAGRDTLQDVGVTLSTESERKRHSLLEVVQAALKRLQESLRSLEEFGKLVSEDLGQSIEGLRYRAYTLERALILGSAARERLAEARLCVLLTPSRCRAGLDWIIAEAAAGGGQVFQLRGKQLPDRDLLELARNVRIWTRKAGVLFIMNDRPDVARLAEADGVHVGQDDLPVREARRILGADALIGVSTHSIEQARRAVLDGASYIGMGPTFPSQTKSFDAFPGTEFIALVVSEISLPAFAIGGITAATLAGVAATGCSRVAVGDAICQADDPRAAAASIRTVLDRTAAECRK